MEKETRAYLGHESQLYGVEEHRLVGGKGDGQRLYEVHNGCPSTCSSEIDDPLYLRRLSQGVSRGS